MNHGFLRGMCIGALAGAAAEMAMIAVVDKTTKHTSHPMRAMGEAVDDAVDNIARTFR